MESNYQDLYEANCKLQSINEELQLEISTLKLQLAQIRKMIYGSKQERFVSQTHPEQLSLGIEDETEGVIASQSIQKINYQRVQPKPNPVPPNHPGRNKLPDHLERKIIVIEPDGVTNSMKKIGEEITEELELEPGKLFVNRYVRPKYVQPTTEQIIIAPMVDRPLPKVIAGAGLLAQLMIDKYVDHLPIYRICERFKRDNVNIPYNTMVDWVGQAINLILPLYEVLKKKILNSNYLHADETGIKVLDKDKKGSTHQGWFWVYHNSIERMVLFDYQPTRGRAAPHELLKNYKGHLQTDGYNVYDIFKQNKDITVLNCMAHARRMFFEAQPNDTIRSAAALGFIQQLYAIERSIKDPNFTLDQILSERHQKSVPILNQFNHWLKINLLEVLPKSPIGKAIAYTLERWKELT
ncbi:MAG: IS66 family transposase, partial [Saprospiraceae bacterium]|nr:IS66 family transposase [Saprospiraceae bacterium]